MTTVRFLILAGVLLAGIGISVAFLSLGHPFASTAYRPLRVPLAEFPLTIGSWKGQDEELGERVLAVAGMDRHLNRVYRTPEGEEVLLYVCYYGNRQRGMRTIYHNPTVCLPSSGWKTEGEELAKVPLASGPRKKLRVSVHTFTRMGRAAQIVNFYIVDDEILDRPPRNQAGQLARQKLKLRSDPGYYVQVQVVPLDAKDPAEGRRLALEFLREAGPHLFRHF